MKRMLWGVWGVAALRACAQGGGCFYGGDLATVSEPYAIRIAAAGAYDVAWGDGTRERVSVGAQGRVQHVYGRTGAFAVSVRGLSPEAPANELVVDRAARVAENRPAVFVSGAVKPGSVLPEILWEPADSFSAECRVWLERPESDQTLLIARDGLPGACYFGLRGGSLVFALHKVGTCSVPLDGRIRPRVWQHLAVTYDRAPLFPKKNRVRFFIDGLPAGDGFIDAVDAGPVYCRSAIAGEPEGNGRLADLAVYGTLLFPLSVLEHAKPPAEDTTLAVTVACRGAADVAVREPSVVRTVTVALDADPKADNGPALRKAVSQAADGTRLKLTDAAGKGNAVFYVRSLLEAPNWAGILVSGKRDFELDGNGCTLVFSDKMARYFWMKSCERVAVRNLSFDLDPTYARVGLYAKLLTIDPETQTLRAQLVNGRDGSPDPLIPRRSSYWRWRPHDPATLKIIKGPHFNSGSYAQPPVADPASGPGVLLFRLKEKPADKLWAELKAYAAGPNFFMINNADFRSNAVSLDDSSHVTFERVNYYATLGMVFLASSTDHLRVSRCKIGLPPGLTAADRPLSAGADGYHFHLMRGSILFEDNEIALTDDDPVSIKDSIWTGVKKAADDRLELRGKIAVGAPVELLNPDYSYTGYTGVVTKAEENLVTLDRRLPDEVRDGSFLMNRSHHTMNWTLRRNYLHDYYGRVMLYTDYGTVVDNRVHNSYYHLGNSTAYFEKAGACRNVVTHRNLFDATVADSSNWGGNQSLISFHEITFSANSFMGQGLKLNNAADSLVARNGFYGEQAFLNVNRCQRTALLDNLRFCDDATAFDIQEKENEAVMTEGNRVLASRPATNP